MSMSEYFVKAFVGAFGLYGLQMLAVPGNMVTDHFDAPATPLLKFWIRGQSVSILGLCFCLTQLETALAVKVAAASAFAVGVLYPWNAKFGYLTPGLPVKYPMHYVPETLMLVLSGVGAYCVFTQQ